MTCVEMNWPIRTTQLTSLAGCSLRRATQCLRHVWTFSATCNKEATHLHLIVTTVQKWQPGALSGCRIWWRNIKPQKVGGHLLWLFVLGLVGIISLCDVQSYCSWSFVVFCIMCKCFCACFWRERKGFVKNHTSHSSSVYYGT